MVGASRIGVERTSDRKVAPGGTYEESLDVVMLTSSLDSESLVRRRVCGLWASLWLGVVWWVVVRTTRGHRIVVSTVAAG